MHAILKVDDLTILFGPTAWQPELFAVELKKLGKHVSLSYEPPTHAIDLGDIRVVPVVEELPVYDETIQTYTTTEEVSADKIQYTHRVVDLPLETVRATYVGRLNEIRRQKEEAGIVVDGLAVSTKREHRSMMIEAFEAMGGDRTTISFNYGTGYTTLTTEQVAKIVAAVKEHPQRCYDAAGKHYEAIMKLKTGQQIKDYFTAGDTPAVMVGWP